MSWLKQATGVAENDLYYIVAESYKWPDSGGGWLLFAKVRQKGEFVEANAPRKPPIVLL